MAAPRDGKGSGGWGGCGEKCNFDRAIPQVQFLCHLRARCQNGPARACARIGESLPPNPPPIGRAGLPQPVRLHARLHARPAAARRRLCLHSASFRRHPDNCYGIAARCCSRASLDLTCGPSQPKMKPVYRPPKPSRATPSTLCQKCLKRDKLCLCTLLSLHADLLLMHAITLSSAPSRSRSARTAHGLREPNNFAILSLPRSSTRTSQKNFGASMQSETNTALLRKCLLTRLSGRASQSRVPRRTRSCPRPNGR